MARQKTQYPGIGERIRDLRIKHGLSQPALCREIDYSSHNTLGNIELGKNVPDPMHITNIATFFGVTEEWLRYGDAGAPKRSAHRVVERPAPQRRAPPMPAPSELTEEDWIAELGDSVPGMARELAQAAWRLARGNASQPLPRPTGLPTMSPPSRSDDAGMLAPSAGSGMRAKAGARKTMQPEKRSVRPASRRR